MKTFDILFFQPEFIREVQQGLGSRALSAFKSGPDYFVLPSTSEPDNREYVWCQQVWMGAQLFSYNSISDAVKKLKSLHRGGWIGASISHHRRAALIGESLKVRKEKPIDFMSPLAQNARAGFCLLDEKTILFCAKVHPPFPRGQMQFQETQEAPSRAYLKLWELFTVYGIAPQKDELVIDMGSCPGGWTWVLSNLGAHVLSVDKAPLDSRLQDSSNVKYIKHDAFTLRPQDIQAKYGKVDWFFSDIICEPPRLVDLIMRWRKEVAVSKFVCTVKFKGQTDMAPVEELLKINGSWAVHLHHNKHELTWISGVAKPDPTVP